jgi:hypothetical protein
MQGATEEARTLLAQPIQHRVVIVMLTMQGCRCVCGRVYASGKRAEDALATYIKICSRWLQSGQQIHVSFKEACHMHAAGKRAEDNFIYYMKSSCVQLASGQTMILMRERLLCAAGERMEDSERIYGAIATHKNLVGKLQCSQQATAHRQPWRSCLVGSG